MLSHALKILHTETPSKFRTHSNELFKRVMMIISIFLAGPETLTGRVEFLGLYGCIKHHKKTTLFSLLVTKLDSAYPQKCVGVWTAPAT